MPNGLKEGKVEQSLCDPDTSGEEGGPGGKQVAVGWFRTAMGLTRTCLLVESVEWKENTTD